MDRTTTLELVGDAVRAPSSHNTQPWSFRADDGIELLADRGRALPVNDPRDRELEISCGAALFGLRVAAAARGSACSVELLPRADEPDLLARVELLEGAPDAELAELRPALFARRTTRDVFADAPLPTGLADAFAAAAEREGARVATLEEGARDAVAELVAEGDRAQFGDSRWRRELASWLRPRRAGDGLTTPALVAPISRAVVRRFDLGRRVGAQDAALARAAPLLVAIGTPGDTTTERIAAGQALHRALLVAAGAGVQAGYLNQPCQVERLRPRLAERLPSVGVPQLLVRLGVPAKAPARSPRRPARDVLRVDGPAAR